MDVTRRRPAAHERTPEALAFAAQLRAERAAAGMSQAELSKRSGVSPSTILRIEQGQRAMDIPQMAAFCRALGVSMTEFATQAERRMRREREAGEDEQQQRDPGASRHA
jgi:transcriptional regulator with XRE-family HTH domain